MKKSSSLYAAIFGDMAKNGDLESDFENTQLFLKF